MFIPKVGLAAEIFHSQTVDLGGPYWSVPCNLYLALVWAFPAVVHEDRINLLGYCRTSKKLYPIQAIFIKRESLKVFHNTIQLRSHALGCVKSIRYNITRTGIRFWVISRFFFISGWNRDPSLAWWAVFSLRGHVKSRRKNWSNSNTFTPPSYFTLGVKV